MFLLFIQMKIIRTRRDKRRLAIKILKRNLINSEYLEIRNFYKSVLKITIQDLKGYVTLLEILNISWIKK